VTATDGGRVASAVRIVEYRREHRERFASLNLEWITTYFAVEDADRKALDDPEGHILRPGGCILMAELGGEVVGTCALIRVADHTLELAKMAVTESARGQGIGFALGAAAVARAKTLGARRVELLSNTVLRPALRLYERLGFVEVPLPETEYRRANVKMVLDLSGAVKCVLLIADDLPTGLAVNAAAVLSLTLGARAPLLVAPGAADGSGHVHAGLTWLPIPVLAASREAIARTREQALAAPDVLVVDLSDVAQRARTEDEYVERLRELRAEDVRYVALALYGDRATVTGLTGGLRLLR
jgi:GNAT superfamily N-acetyltransferase